MRRRGLIFIDLAPVYDPALVLLAASK